jgi:hypothetical protein
MKRVFVGLLSLISIIVLIFALEFIGLGFFKFFEPKRENVRREIFENTQSYTHGKIQELAKYYEEYNKADDQNDKETIKQMIKIKFAEFDESKINSPKLKLFLENTRGY